jgi:hypothetical protein
MRLWGAEQVDFNRDIRPILSEKCYYCHGPDEQHREADLRLDTPAGARAAIESGEFLSRIFSDDPERVMPKPSSKLNLSATEKDLLKRWLEAGARYESHWAFRQLPNAVPVPTDAGVGWAREQFDHFIAAQLVEHALEPAAEAEPLRWLRRVTLDLTGLPPTVGEVEAFQSQLAGDREMLYRATVDRLLQSPAYGEHLAVMWLDAARYADSYGYQSDKLNNQWPYRDWVIQALNDNLPYDQFLQWQLAGDLLPEPTIRQRLATSFNRIHRLNNEGGAVFEEWRQENVADRVHTFGTAILGLTLECCRCHDHKYDPISTREYYALSAFFNSIDENGMYDRTEKVPSPSMLLPTPEQAEALEVARRKVEEARLAYEAARAGAADRWQRQRGESSSAQAHTFAFAGAALPDRRFAFTFDEPWTAELASSYEATTLDKSKTPPLETIEVADSPLPPLAASQHPRRALKLDGDRGMAIMNVDPIDRWTPFSLVLNLRETKRQPLAAVIAQHCRGTDAGYNGWDLVIEDGYLETRLYRVWPGNALGVRTREPIAVDPWHQIAVTYDGLSRAEGLKIFLDGKPLAVDILRDNMIKSANVKVDHGGRFVIGQRFRGRGLDGGLIDDVQFYNRSLSAAELMHLASGQPLKVTKEYYASALDEECRQATNALQQAIQQWVMVEESMNELPIMKELPQPRPAYVLARGEYDAPKNEHTRVDRDVPKNLGLPFAKKLPRDRWGLAQWVTDPRHPLTSRVIVNRLWANFFGAGLVRTPENFGLTGEQPSHPALLDWLARDLIHRNWNIKEFCKQLVLSATYRQDSAVTPEKLAKDPENRWLSRGSSHRLAAEQIRDLALVASGLLSDERGGPPVSPYQAGGDLWRENNGMSPPYQQSVGRALHRRSIYSVWKRTAPLPNMMAFDTNSREVCTVKRQRTNTPLQALVLMNDVQFIEAARCLAERLLLKRASPSAVPADDEQADRLRFRQAFIAFTSRQPAPREEDLLLTLLAEERQYYQAETAEAEKLVAIGDTPSRLAELAKLQAVEMPRAAAELAAWTHAIQAIMNLDAAIWSR